MSRLIIIPLLLCSLLVHSQDRFSNVELIGEKRLIIEAKTGDLYKSSTLSTGESIRTGYAYGASYFRIEYKGRKIEVNFSEGTTNLSIFEFDFGEDGDNEIVLINEYNGTAYVYIYSYGRGLIQQIFEKEIWSYKTVISSNYIEFFMPSGLDKIWHYYQGSFWEMTPVKLRR